MRPHVDETPIRALLLALPEFEANYLDLVELYDEDLTPQVVFSELAEMVGGLLEEDDDEELLERCFDAVETVAATPGVDCTEVIAYAFLDNLTPAARDLAGSWLGPRTAAILTELEDGTAEIEDRPLGDADVADMEELERRGVLPEGTARRLVSLAAERGGTAPPR